MANLAAFLGSVVRVAPNLLSFSEPALLPDIYHRHADKTPFYNTGMAGEEPVLLQTQTHADHASKLKVIGPSVSVGYGEKAISADVALVLDSAYAAVRRGRR